MADERLLSQDDEKTVRLGISLPRELLVPFDGLLRRRGYNSRSEAVRDLIRRELVAEEWREAEGEIAGTLTLVYDHHNRDLPGRLTDIQHECFGLVVTTQHVHLDHHNCLEVLVLRGNGREVRRLADQLIACTGVKHGVFVPSTTGKALV